MNFVVHILFFYSDSTSYKFFKVTHKVLQNFARVIYTRGLLYQKSKKIAIPQKCASKGPHSALKYIARLYIKVKYINFKVNKL